MMEIVETVKQPTWWLVRFIKPHTPSVVVSGDQLDQYYRRKDVFEITQTNKPE